MKKEECHYCWWPLLLDGRGEDDVLITTCFYSWRSVVEWFEMIPVLSDHFTHFHIIGRVVTHPGLPGVLHCFETALLYRSNRMADPGCGSVDCSSGCQDTGWRQRPKAVRCGWFRIGCKCQGDLGDGQFYLSRIGGCIPGRVIWLAAVLFHGYRLSQR
jgi:hypothetical protein